MKSVQQSYRECADWQRFVKEQCETEIQALIYLLRLSVGGSAAKKAACIQQAAFLFRIVLCLRGPKLVVFAVFVR